MSCSLLSAGPLPTCSITLPTSSKDFRVLKSFNMDPMSSKAEREKRVYQCFQESSAKGTLAKDARSTLRIRESGTLINLGAESLPTLLYKGTIYCSRGGEDDRHKKERIHTTAKVVEECYDPHCSRFHSESGEDCPVEPGEILLRGNRRDEHHSLHSHIYFTLRGRPHQTKEFEYSRLAMTKAWRAMFLSLWTVIHCTSPLEETRCSRIFLAVLAVLCRIATPSDGVRAPMIFALINVPSKTRC